MPPSHPRRWPALLLLSLLPLLQACSNSFAVVTRTPTISPAGGEFSAPVTVTLTDATPSAILFYTLDGTTPTSSSNRYTTPFTLAQSATVQAIATAPSDIPSFIARATFTIAIPPVAAAPTFAPPAGTYTAAQSVTLSDATPNATIYYTTNGTTPTTASPIYTTPIPVSASETISAIASAPGYTISPIATAAYIIQIPQTAAPTFAPPAGTYTAAQSVTLSDTTPNASIYYTTNGTTPATSSTLYTTPIPVSTSQTISVIAIAPGYTLSPVASAAYVIQIPASTCANRGPGIICTVAGNGTEGFSGNGGPATSAELSGATGVAVDSSGNLYIADPGNNVIRKVTPAGIISTVAGGGTQYPGDGGPATSAELLLPYYVTVDSSGNIYFPDGIGNRIRKVTPAGVISTVAGNGTFGFSGDGGPATSAQLWSPGGVAVDSGGNVYIADGNNCRIRKVTPAGIISTIAGTGINGDSGDGGPATSAKLAEPSTVTLDSNGNLYIVETESNVIRMVTPAGIISTVAGTEFSFGYSGDGGPATSAHLNLPSGAVVDSSGNLYIADADNSRIRMVTPAGIISTVAGNGIYGFSGDGGPATTAELKIPTGVALDASGNLYIGDDNGNRVREVFATATAAPTFTPPGGTYTSTQTVTLTSTTPNATIYYTTNGTTPTTSSTLYTAPLTVSTSETIQAIAIAPGYTASPVATAVYTISAAVSGCSLFTGFSSGTICTVAGNGIYGYSGDGGPAIGASITDASGVAVDSSGNLYIADGNNNRIRKVTSAGVISTVAGNGTRGYSGDGGAATSAALNDPTGVTVDSSGNLYIVDSYNDRIRKVTPAGTISTVAGDGSHGYSGDGGSATSAALQQPFDSVALDSSGNLYIADFLNNRIRRVTPAGIISTVAGNGVYGFSGDGGQATSAELAFPVGIAVDTSGNLYIADGNNNRIRKVTPAGIISTVAGNGTAGYSGDGAAATTAELNGPDGVAVDGNGNLYIADIQNSRIRKVTPAGIISTVAGDGTAGYAGDSGAATNAELNFPYSVVVDSNGVLFIADSFNDRIRKVIP